MAESTRRRSPWWVRELDAQKVHHLAGHLLTKFRTDGLSSNEEWLYDGLLSELEYRRRRAVEADRCTCMFCVSPFPEGP